MTSQTLFHIIAATQKEDLTESQEHELVLRAKELGEDATVANVWIGRRGINFVVVLELTVEAHSLESFSASPSHVSFVVHALGPVITGMWSADFASNVLDPLINPRKFSYKYLTVIAIKSQARLFEWQIDQWGESLTHFAGQGNVVLGPTIEERDLYRSAGLLFSQVPTGIGSLTGNVFQDAEALVNATDCVEVDLL